MLAILKQEMSQALSIHKRIQYFSFQDSNLSTDEGMKDFRL